MRSKRQGSLVPSHIRFGHFTEPLNGFHVVLWNSCAVTATYGNIILCPSLTLLGSHSPPPPASQRRLVERRSPLCNTNQGCIIAPAEPFSTSFCESIRRAFYQILLASISSAQVAIGTSGASSPEWLSCSWRFPAKSMKHARSGVLPSRVGIFTKAKAMRRLPAGLPPPRLGARRTSVPSIRLPGLPCKASILFPTLICSTRSPRSLYIKDKKNARDSGASPLGFQIPFDSLLLVLWGHFK